MFAATYCMVATNPIHPSIHIWCYSPFRALASLIRRLYSSLFSVLLFHPFIPTSCSASLWTTSAHLVLGLSIGLLVWKFPFQTFFLILSSDRLCGLVVRVSDYRYRGLGFDSRHFQIF